MNIGKALKTCRELKQWSLVELAVFSGLAKEHLRLVEAGKRDLPKESIEKVSKLFGVPSELFAFISMEKKDLSNIRPELINKIKELVN